MRFADRFDDRLAVHSRAQADTFDPVPLRIIGNGIVTDRYDVHVLADAPRHLGAVGRISPEKAWRTSPRSPPAPVGRCVWGLMQDPQYWQQVLDDHPAAHLDYRRFLPTDELQARSAAAPQS